MGAATPRLIIFYVIISINIMLEDLARLGKDFKWEKPSICPCCENSKLWGHGFVKCYFNGFSHSLWLKRYRCPSCNSVITVKPSGYWSRFKSSVQTIYNTLSYRFLYKKWPLSISRQRAGNWMRAFIKNIKMLIYDRFGSEPFKILQICFEKNINFLSSK